MTKRCTTPFKCFQKWRTVCPSHRSGVKESNYESGCRIPLRNSGLCWRHRAHHSFYEIAARHDQRVACSFKDQRSKAKWSKVRNNGGFKGTGNSPYHSQLERTEASRRVQVPRCCLCDSAAIKETTDNDRINKYSINVGLLYPLLKDRHDCLVRSKCW